MSTISLNTPPLVFVATPFSSAPVSTALLPAVDVGSTTTGIQLDTQQASVSLPPANLQSDVSLSVNQNTPPVSISPSADNSIFDSPVYSKPLVSTNVLRNTTYSSVAATQTSQSLLDELNVQQNQKADFSASRFFNQVGALSRETNEYRNEARSALVPAGVAPEKFTPDFSKGTGKIQQSAHLFIRTKDGDEVTIEMAHRAGANGDSVDFSFKVKGNLSEEEQNAIDALAKKFGQMADDFFRNTHATLNGLDDVDTEKVTTFNFVLAKPKGDDYANLHYDFSIDPLTQIKHLLGKDGNGYSLDIQANTKKLMLGAIAETTNVLRQYLNLLTEKTNEANVSAESQFFMGDALAFMLAPKHEKFRDGNDVNDSGLNAVDAKALDNNNIINAFGSGLSDFNASFSAPTTHARGQYLFPTSMSLHLQQSTRLEQQGDHFLMQQTARFEFNSVQTEALLGMHAGDVGAGNFDYKSIHEEGKNTRSLDMTKSTVNNVTTEKTHEKTITEKLYQGFILQDKKQSSESAHELKQLSDSENMKLLNSNKLSLLAALKKEKDDVLFI